MTKNAVPGAAEQCRTTGCKITLSMEGNGKQKEDQHQQADSWIHFNLLARWGADDNRGAASMDASILILFKEKTIT